MSRKGGGKDHPHKKFNIVLPKIQPDSPMAWLVQLQYIHKRFGKEGALLFLRKTEQKDGLPIGTLDLFLPFIGEKNG